MLKKILLNLIFWVLLSITMGIFLGHYYPNIAKQNILPHVYNFDFYLFKLTFKPTFSEFLSSIFISSIKIFINPIIFVTIILGFLNMGDIKKVGKIGSKAIIYFEVITTFALFFGIVMAYLIQPGNKISNIPASTSLNFIPTTQSGFHLFDLLKENITLQVLILAIFIGVVLSKSKLENQTITIHFFNKLANKLFWILSKIMYLAPIGAFGGMATTISKYGIESLMSLVWLLLTIYLTMFVFIFVVLGLILFYYKKNIWTFIKYIKEEILIVFATSSSESALPFLMQKLENLGYKKSNVSMIVPMGYSFNLDGSTIYLSIATIFLTQVYNIHLTTDQIITTITMLMVMSKGTAGVSGSAFIILTSTIYALQIVPVDSVTILLGIDLFMAQARAVTNFIGNGVATIALCENEMKQ